MTREHDQKHWLEWWRKEERTNEWTMMKEGRKDKWMNNDERRKKGTNEWTMMKEGRKEQTNEQWWRKKGQMNEQWLTKKGQTNEELWRKKERNKWMIKINVYNNLPILTNQSLPPIHKYVHNNIKPKNALFPQQNVKNDMFIIQIQHYPVCLSPVTDWTTLCFDVL